MLWAADSFAALFPGEVYEANDVPADLGVLAPAGA
jgi:hypothetical protein